MEENNNNTTIQEEKAKIREDDFCRYFTGVHPMRCIAGVFYDYDGAVNEESLCSEVYGVLRGAFPAATARTARNMVEALRLYCYSEPLHTSARYVNVSNGRIDAKGSFFPYKDFCMNRLPVSYDPELRKGEHPPRLFLRYLSEMIAQEDIPALQEYLGYLLIPSTKAQKMLFLVGHGGEGKSVLGTVLRSIFGQSMMTGNFQRIETDRFFRYNLKDKLFLLDDDTQIEALQTTGYIKNLVTAETPVDVEAKGKQSEQAYLYARLLCFGNTSPRALHDKTFGFLRRLLIINTLPPPRDRIPDPFLAEKLCAEKEKIFCWMLDGLIRLVQNQYRFSVSQRMQQNVEEVMQDICSIAEFMQDKDTVRYDRRLAVSSANLYQYYCGWCSANGLYRMRQDSVTQWLKQNAEILGIRYTNKISYNGKNVRGFSGFTVNT